MNLTEHLPQFCEQNITAYRLSTPEQVPAKSLSHYIGSEVSIRLANASELWMIQRLEDAQIEYDYEATKFDLGEHITKRRFMTPDLYLPALDLFVELTVGEEFIVNRKQRRLVHLRRNYPDVKIILLTVDDFYALVDLNPAETLDYFEHRMHEPTPTKPPQRTNFHEMQAQMQTASAYQLEGTK